MRQLHAVENRLEKKRVFSAKNPVVHYVRGDHVRAFGIEADPTAPALLVVNARRRIRCANSRVRRCLRRHFRVQYSTRTIPKELRAWLDSPTHPFHPLVIRHGRHRLTISLLYPDADGLVCLLVAENLVRITHQRAEVSLREEQVMWRAAAGESDKEIATALGLAPTTVRKHLQSVFAKLGVNNRTAAVGAFKHYVNQAA
jgi:DNA-binding CsgD family transcriptional regulator